MGKCKLSTRDWITAKQAQWQMKNYFQYRCYGDHPWLKLAGESLFREYLSSRTRRPTRESAKQFRRAFITALSGLYIGGAFRQTSDPILITLNKNSYNGKTQLSPVFQPELLAAFKWLISSGYLMQVSKEHQIDGGVGASRLPANLKMDGSYPQCSAPWGCSLKHSSSQWICTIYRDQSEGRAKTKAQALSRENRYAAAINGLWKPTWTTPHYS